MHSYFDILDSLESDIEALETQNEEGAVEAAIESYQNMASEVRKSKSTDNTERLKPEAVLMRKLVVPFTEAIERHMQKSGPRRGGVVWGTLDGVKPIEVAVIAVRIIVNTLTIAEPVQSTAERVASELLLHMNYTRLARLEETKPLVKSVKKNLAGSTHTHKVRALRAVLNDSQDKIPEEFAREEWDTAFMAQVGVTLIQCFIEATGAAYLGNYNFKRSKGGPQLLALLPTPDMVKWLEKADNMAALTTTLRPPMLMPPMDWNSIDDGGYITAFRVQPKPLVKTRRKSALNIIRSADTERYRYGVNILQQTPWKVNTFILDVLQEAVNRGGDIAGLPPLDKTESIPVAPWVKSGMDPEEYKTRFPDQFKEWKRDAAIAHGQWTDSVSKRFSLFKGISMARQYKDRPAIWFPYFSDWRGRVYPQVPAHLNPQGKEHAKALLQFAEGKPIGERGIYWLMVHLANCAGVDKVSFDDRVAWVEENKRDILQAAKDPWSTDFWRSGVDDPFKFLAAARELLGVEQYGESYISHTPIALDGSCNAYQHYAAMMRDLESGAEVNMINRDKPGDIYSKVKAAVERNMLNMMRTATDEEVQHMLRLWMGKVDRALCKRGVMTTPYGVTSWGIGSQILEELGKRATRKQNPDGSYTQVSYLGENGVDGRASRFLGDMLEQGVNEVVTLAPVAMRWFQEVAFLASGYGDTLTWTTPSGFKVVQQYHKQTGMRVKTIYGNSSVSLTYKVDTDVVDPRSMRQAVAPCFVHSMDAAHLINTTIRCYEEYDIRSLATVHDSYATHPSDTDVLASAIREEFVKIYQRDVMQNFADEVQEQYPSISLPALPAKGNLDIQSVLQAPYFFA